MTVSPTAAYDGEVADNLVEGSGTVTRGESVVAEPGAATPWQPPRSRVDRATEEAALACVRRGRRDEALKLLMTAYGAPLTAFATRILRDPELAKDVRQQVFLSAYQRFDTFEGRSSLWSWLCSIAYHRCLDERRRIRRGAIDDSDVLDDLIESSESIMSQELLAKRRALERCLGNLTDSMRTQLLMRCHLGLSYAEIGEVVGDPHGTVQVRISRILPRLRRCLEMAGVTR